MHTKSESFDLFCRCVRKQTAGSKNSKLHLNVISNLVFFKFLHLSVNAFISLPGKQSSCTCCPHCTQTLCVFIFVELFKGTFKMICQLKHRYFLFCSASYMLKCIAAHGIYTKNVFCCGPLYPPSRAINVCVMYNWYVFASCRNRIVVDVTVLNI